MKISTRLLTILGLSALTYLPAQSVPEYVNYQGLLKAADGSPLATGSYTIEFNIYDQANAGTKVWGPFAFDGSVGGGHGPLVPVVNGGFNVILGPKDTGGASLAGAFAGPNRFIEIKVNGGDPILPRQQFLSAAYTLQSQKAQLADVASSLVKNLADALCPPGSILAFAGPASRIPDGWLLCDGRILASTNHPRLFAAIGKAWGDGSWSHVNDAAENPPLPWTDFNLPDLRGMFLRAANANQPNSYWRDADAATRSSWQGSVTEDGVGTYQSEGSRAHQHMWANMQGTARFAQVSSWTTNGYEVVLHGSVNGDAAGGGGDDAFGVNGGPHSAYTSPTNTIYTPTFAGETRPKNACVNYIIKDD
jgi:microcystin-dependent protein